jgi:hypothetical protein
MIHGLNHPVFLRSELWQRRTSMIAVSVEVSAMLNRYLLPNLRAIA